MRISVWSSDVCSPDLFRAFAVLIQPVLDRCQLRQRIVGMQLTIDRGKIRVPLLFQDVVDERQRFGLRLETRHTADLFISHRAAETGYTRCWVPNGIEEIVTSQLFRILPPLHTP